MPWLQSGYFAVVFTSAVYIVFDWDILKLKLVMWTPYTNESQDTVKITLTETFAAIVLYAKEN